MDIIYYWGRKLRMTEFGECPALRGMVPLFLLLLVGIPGTRNHARRDLRPRNPCLRDSPRIRVKPWFQAFVVVLPPCILVRPVIKISSRSRVQSQRRLVRDLHPSALICGLALFLFSFWVAAMLCFEIAASITPPARLLAMTVGICPFPMFSRRR